MNCCNVICYFWINDHFQSHLPHRFHNEEKQLFRQNRSTASPWSRVNVTHKKNKSLCCIIIIQCSVYSVYLLRTTILKITGNEPMFLQQMLHE